MSGTPTSVVSDRVRSHATDNGWWFGVRDTSYGGSYTGWHRYTDRGGSSRGDDSIAGALEHDDRCIECGLWIEYGYSRDARLRSETVCFGCDHYLQHIAEFDPARDAIISNREGTRCGYHIAPATRSPNHCKGHSGRKFTIRFTDGRLVETDNLWCWSDSIPSHFHDRLPVNAEFAERVA